MTNGTSRWAMAAYFACTANSPLTAGSSKADMIKVVPTFHLRSARSPNGSPTVSALPPNRKSRAGPKSDRPRCSDLRAHRLRQNAGRVSDLSRPPGAAGAHRYARRGDAGCLCLAAESALERRPQESGNAARRDRGAGRAARRAARADPHRRPHRRYAGVRSASGCARKPPHILVTTPESLFILLTAERSREMLRTVRTVIVDEIHAVADDKRGSHLALTLARLNAVAHKCQPQRIGLSATVQPDRRSRGLFLGSPDTQHHRRRASPRNGPGRRSPQRRTRRRRHQRDVGGDLRPPGRPYPRASARRWSSSTRGGCRNAWRTRWPSAWAPNAVLPHHGSLSRTLRHDAESRLKNGELRAVVATASLELGIDIGTVDLAIQIGSPRSIAVALQRIGRSGPLGGREAARHLFPHHAR